MLNFEEELKKFKPCLEVEDIEEAVYQEDKYMNRYIQEKFLREILKKY